MSRTSVKTEYLTADRTSVLCYELALMFKAGVSSEESVELLLRDLGEGWQRDILDRVGEGLSKGLPLSEALEGAGAFPDYLVRMVEIGQASGRLEQVLSSLSVYYQRQADTQSAIRRTVAYPCLMALLIALVFSALVSRVLPVFEQVFHQLGMTLPPSAALMLRMGDTSRVFAAVLAALFAAAALLLLYLFRTEGGARLSRRLSLRLFSGTTVSRAVDRSRFASSMALMLSSGLSLDEALERTARLLEDAAIHSKLEDCRRLLDSGSPFSAAVEEAGLLDGLQAGLLAAGFRTGAPEQAMEELSRRCGVEADERLGLLLGRFEYALVLALCLSVGTVLLSVMLPLLGVMSAIGV